MNNICYLCGVWAQGGKYFRVKVRKSKPVMANFNSVFPNIDLAHYEAVLVCNRCLMLDKFEGKEGSIYDRLREKSCQTI